MSKAKKLLFGTRHIALATVNEDGSPHNTPLFFMYNEDISKVYWGSHPNSLHSKNIEREGLGYLVVYDSDVYDQGGVYITLENGHKVTEKELDEALRVHNITRKRWGKDSLPIEYYSDPNPQKMYVADVAKIESYESNRDEKGRVIEEVRVEISADELLNG